MSPLMDAIFVVFQHTVKSGSYTWTHNRPPARHSRPFQSNIVDVDAMIDLFGRLLMPHVS